MALDSPTITTAVQSFLEVIRLARSENTWKAYQTGLNLFLTVLDENDCPPATTQAQALDETALNWFISKLKAYSPSSEQLYLTAAVRFFEYLSAENLAEINLPKLKMLVRMRARKSPRRLPQFPREAIESVLSYAESLKNSPADDTPALLRNFRDRAFLLTLADTGLRVHEACGLRRGDLDWNEGRAIIIGKGNRQDVVRFSQRSFSALRDYLSKRATLDGASRRPLASLPLFARHDRGAGRIVKSITTTTGRNIVNRRVREALGWEAVGTITPHSFRHYFVTTVLLSTGGNLKLAQELARHQNISVTQRYAHLSDDELDRGYYEIFNRRHDADPVRREETDDPPLP